MTRQSCETCGEPFEVSPEDLAAYDRLSPVIGASRLALPPPRRCPNCRKRRRLAFRNERKFYRSQSALTGEPMISTFSPEKPFQVYEFDEWWSDAYQPLDYGRAIDFDRPFFEQLQELLRAVPQMGLVGSQNENCPYCHLLANCKNCYCIVESSNNEDCYYSYWMQKCTGCCDSSFCHECQFCYEVDNCYSCYDLRWSRDCTNCSESAFLDGCIGCRHCIGCTNLHQKEYWVLNRPVGKEGYEAFLAAHRLSSRQGVAAVRKLSEELWRTQPRKYAHILQTEESTGDFLVSCRRCYDCYHGHDAEECRYSEHVWRNSKYNMDVSTAGRDAELIYESINVGISSYRVSFSIQGWSSSNVQYCIGCFNSQYCFGCAGLKRQRYCILNREYSPAEYETLVVKLAEHMRATGEWGEFFPEWMSPYGYNETVAQSMFPLTKEEALSLGFQWSDYEAPPPAVKSALSRDDVPDDIADAGEELLQCALVCELSGRPYRVIAQEFEYYQSHGLPIPVRHPDVRHEERNQRRTGQTLRAGNCAQCASPFVTPCRTDEQRPLLCDTCYASAID